MELRHLRYFVAVAEEQSFTRAAERLWIAQPGLSQQIRALERELGVTLLTRHSRGVLLTEAGELFLERARCALAAVEGALATGRGAGAGMLGHLRVGLGTMSRGDLGPKLLQAFRAERPQVDVTVVEAHSETLVRDVRHRRLDAAVVIGPVTHSELQATCLREERVLVAAGEDHRLARLTRVHPEDLEGATVVISGDRDGRRYDDRVTELLGELGVRTRTQAAGYGAGLLSPVRSQGAIALVPRSGADAGGGVVTRPLQPPLTFRFDLVWPVGTPSPALDGFIDCSRRAALAADPLRFRQAGRAAAAARAVPALTRAA